MGLFEAFDNLADVDVRPGLDGGYAAKMAEAVSASLPDASVRWMPTASTIMRSWVLGGGSWGRDH